MRRRLCAPQASTSAIFFVPSLKVRTRAPTEWALKTHQAKPDELKLGVKDVQSKLSKGKRLLIYKVDQIKFPKGLREFKPWEYLKASGNELLATDSQAALQSVFHTASVLREQRILATKSMTLGRVVWRKILWTMKREADLIRHTRKWYLVPFLYLKYRYLRYCILEILTARDLIFRHFGFRYADLRKDPDTLRPKASYLRAFRTKELLFREDSQSMTEELKQAQRAYYIENDLYENFSISAAT
jgi:hypothetical protein